MDDLTLILIVCAVIFFLLIKGVVKTFKRQPVVAILCLIFLFPIFAIWAFIELFTGSNNKGTNALSGESNYEIKAKIKAMEAENEAIEAKIKAQEAEIKAIEAENKVMEAENKADELEQKEWLNRKKTKEDIIKQSCFFFQSHIQEVLDAFITEGYAISGFFIFNVSESEGVYAQGVKVSDDTCIIQISGSEIRTNSDNFDIKKFKKLVSLGWKIPNGEDDNFNLEVSIEDLLEGKVAKLIFETLKVFDLPDGKINCTYD